MNVVRALILVTFGTLLAAPAAAQVTEIYKCIDASGRPLYTSDKKETAGRKCELVSREINVVPAQKANPKSPSSFPRESAAERSSRATARREILEKELATEQQLLTKAQQALAEQESVRMGDEKNYARVQERLQPFKDNVELHTKNIEALRRELANLNR
jgi:hypothetical protein